MSRLATGAAGAAALLLAVAPATPAGADPPAIENQPLETAGRAASELSFVGVVEVRWFDHASERRETLLVHGANGSVVVRGDTAAMASPQQRLVEHEGGEWDLLWPARRPGVTRPELTRKYELTSASGPTVGGRVSRLVEVSRDGSLVERLYLDSETGLLLRREQFENGARPRRTVGFETVAIGGATPAPQVPDDVVNLSPRPLAPGRLPRRVSAPPTLADGYQRLGVYRHSGVVQALYSDGLYDLSVFEQEGRLDRHDLPAGDRLQAGGRIGRHYSWPGGHILLWQQGGTVYTAVSDAPLEQLLRASASVPSASSSPPLLRRLRQVCRWLVQPLAA